jgi:hypothetical protein
MGAECQAIPPVLPSKHYSMNLANILLWELSSLDPSAVRLVRDIIPHARDLNDIKNDAGFDMETYRVQKFESTQHRPNDPPIGSNPHLDALILERKSGMKRIRLHQVTQTVINFFAFQRT